MAEIGCFVERYTISRSAELKALTNFRRAAEDLGHGFEFLFRPDLHRIPEFDALFIRALTDPMNASYVASRMGELAGLRVIDDPASIVICCDKVNMYRHLQRARVPMPCTEYVRKAEMGIDRAAILLRRLGEPLVLKAPYSSFSAYVERVSTPEELLETAKRYLRRSSMVVAQEYVPSTFDWRITTLGGEVLFVCKYLMPGNHWKLILQENGRTRWGAIEAVPANDVDPALLEVALRASRAIGDGLYGVDVKETPNGYVVIEVNDNPNIDAGFEDALTPEVYGRIIGHLVSP